MMDREEEWSVIERMEEKSILDISREVCHQIVIDVVADIEQQPEEMSIQSAPEPPPMIKQQQQEMSTQSVPEPPPMIEQQQEEMSIQSVPESPPMIIHQQEEMSIQSAPELLPMIEQQHEEMFIQSVPEPPPMIIQQQEEMSIQSAPEPPPMIEPVQQVVGQPMEDLPPGGLASQMTSMTAMEVEGVDNGLSSEPQHVDEQGYTTVQITITDYVHKLRQRDVRFNILGHIAHLVDHDERDGVIYLRLQAQNTQFLVAPDSFHIQTSSEIAQAISDDNQATGRVIQVRLSEQETDELQQTVNQQQTVEQATPTSATNNVIQSPKPNQEQQRARVAASNLPVRPLSCLPTNAIPRQVNPRTTIHRQIGPQMLSSNIRRVINPARVPLPKPKTTIEVLDDDGNHVFDDEEFFKPLGEQTPLNKGPPPPENPAKFAGLLAGKVNGTLNSAPLIRRATPAAGSKPPLNSLTRSTKTYARTKILHSSIKANSGTISTVVGSQKLSDSRQMSNRSTLTQNKDALFDSLVLSPGQKRGISTIRDDHSKTFYCNGCGASFIYITAFSTHRSWCRTRNPGLDNVNNESTNCGDKHLYSNEDEMKRRKIDLEFDDDKDVEEDLSSICSDDDAQLKGFHENDLVWVNLKSGQWPAFIMKLYIQEEKAEIQLIHSILKKNSWKEPVDRLQKYDDGVRNMKMRTLKDENLFKAFKASEQYLLKRALDENLNPYVFFANSKMLSAAKPPKKVLDIDFRKVIRTIKEGKVETHLIGIFKETLPSQRQTAWKSGQRQVETPTQILDESGKESKSEVQVGFGTMKDEELQDDLRTYCTNLFVTNFPREATDDLMLYMMNVWIPEAIVRGISKCYNIDVKEAEVYFT